MLIKTDFAILKLKVELNKLYYLPFIMRQLFFIVTIYLITSCTSFAQKSAYKGVTDSLIFKEYFDFCNVNNIDDRSTIFSYFVGTPYESGTLEINEKESLIVNLRAFDCLTFVESTVALYNCLKNNTKDITDFEEILKNIRYRGGKIIDYTSRLHYSSDWIYNNTRNNIIEDITKSLGGKILKVNVAFMSTHPLNYKQLRNKKQIDSIRNIENNINSRKYYYIPKSELVGIEDKLEDGDIIFITTNIKGLDISHVGFAIKLEGKTHLLHASSYYKKVVVSENTLYNYLNNIKHNTGIIVCRLK